MLSRHSTRACCGLLLSGLLALAVGCGPNYKARANVKGKVTIGKKHLTAGTVVFYGKDLNMTGSATIDKHGNYVMNDAPLGDVKITVTVPQPPPGGTARMKMLGGPAKKGLKDVKSVDPNDPSRSISIMGDMPKEVVSIPDKYSKVETSGLTYTVTRGEHTHDIPLTP
jgi:hypothetical protein